MLLLILLSCGDIATNPGPSSSGGLDCSFQSLPGEVPISNTTHPLFLSFNANSLLSKIDEVRSLCSVYHPAAICVQETKLDARIISREVDIDGYSLFRCDRNRNGGGVAIYACDSLSPQHCSRGCPMGSGGAKWELVAVALQFSRNPVTVVSAYFSPSNSAAIWDSFMSELEDFISMRNPARMILCGDLNHCASSTLEFRLLQRLADSYSLQQAITEPTHVTATSQRIIDLVFLGMLLRVSASGLAPPIEKTHSVVWVQLCDLYTPIAASSFRATLWKEADWDRAAFMLGYLPDGSPRDWTLELWQADSGTVAAQKFLTYLREVFRTCVPSKLVKLPNQPSAPWFSSSIRSLIQRRNRLYAKFKSQPSPSSRKAFIKLKRAVKKEVFIAKRDFVMHSFGEVTTTGDFWRVLRKVSGQGPKSIPPLSMPDGSFASSDQQKAVLISEEFVSNFNPAASPPPEYPIDEPLDAEFLCPSDFILYWILQLRLTVSVGLDAIPARFIRGCTADLIIPLRCIINRCMLEGSFPTEWKLARMVPIPKVPNPNAALHFRPISILPILSKLMESWLLHCLRPFLEPAPNQFAFWKGRSTEDALAFVQHSVSRAMECCVNKRRPPKVAILSFDIRKAFDQISHRKLLEILEHRGVPVPLLRVLSAYLSCRSQRVCIGKAMSKSVACSSGVPQGSVVGGPLFNVYIDGVLSLQLSSGAVLTGYADDLLLIKPLPTSAAEIELQDDINIIVGTYSELLLSVQPKKLNLLIASIAPQPLTISTLPSVSGVPITAVSSLKYLGAKLDRKLDFGENAWQTAVRSRQIFGALRRACRPILGTRAFSYIYLTKIFPLLTYDIAVLAPARKGPFHALEKAHRLAARWVANDWRSPYSQLLVKLGWKSVARVCFERRCLLVWKYLHELRHLPPATVAKKQLADNRYRYRLRNAPHELDLEIPRSNKTTIDELPFYNCLHTWNALPSAIKSAPFSVLRQAVRNIQNFITVQTVLGNRLPSSTDL